MRLLLPVLALATIAAPASARPAAHAATAAARDWSRVTSATSAGGFVMGNPNARVKLVEYGSLTCPHCRHFDEEGVTPLVSGYVRTGKVSWEFRPYLISGYDVPVTLTASCGGAAHFFPMMRALYAAQPQWIAKMEGIPDDRLQAIQKMPPEQQFTTIGQAAGLPAFAAAHGIPAAKATACLGNKAQADAIVNVTRVAAEKYKVNGTPTFFVNGAMVDYSKGPTVWGVIKASLDTALKG